MGLMNKLKFWKKDDFDDFGSDFNSNKNDPLGDLGKDPLSDMGNDPLSSSHDSGLGPIDRNDNHQENFPKNDFMQQQKSPFEDRDPGPKVNEIGMGNQQAHDYDRVQQRQTPDPFGPQQNFEGTVVNKDFEILVAKIDTVRVTVENIGHRIEQIDQRISIIEEIAKQEQNDSRQQEQQNQNPGW